ncbi:putative reverse transcriptase, RNA-dependent DNA polymerase [Tanacetum coccineum]
METDEVSERYIAPCFVNGLEAYDGEINLAFDENLISNEYAVKLSLDYKEDDVEPGVMFGRSFMRLVNGIVDFGSGLGGEELPSFVCKIRKSSRNKKRAMENLNLFYPYIETSSSTGRHLIQEEAMKEALALRHSQKFALLEEEEAINKVKGEALKEKDDPGAFIFPIRLEGKVNENALADIGSDINTMPYRIYEQLGREEIKKVNIGITMINHTQAEAMGILTNVLCLVGVTTIIAKFLILDIPIDRDAPIVVGRGFIYTIGGILNTPERLFLTFDGFCHQTFRAARSDVLRTAESDSEDEELWEETMMKPDHQDQNALDNMKPWKRYCFHKFIMNSYYRKVATKRRSLETDDMLRINLLEAESNEKIFTSVAWIRAFNIKEPIYLEPRELCFDYPELSFKGGSQDDHLWLVSKDYWVDKEKGAGTQRESQIYCRQFITKIARKARVLNDVVLRSLSAPIYYRDLDTTTLRELIDSEGRLIPEDPKLSVPRVGIPRTLRASMQDFY